jgi:hypothetical protein
MMRLAVCVLIALLIAWPSTASAESGWSVDDANGALRMSWDGKPVARYVYNDPVITRPYFADLCAPSGVQVTRTHPPVAGVDRMDHPEFHPGVWLAFGNLNEADNWRLKAKVEHHSFTSKPTAAADGAAEFTAENHYLDANGKLICKGKANHTLEVTPVGLLVTYDETFSSDSEFVFGDQEEMGFGVRLATPLRVEKGGPDPAPAGTGEFIADGGRRGSAEIWGQPAKWLDYRGQLDGAPAGMALFCHPDNFRPSRMHARDYGFVCANPFATAAFKAGEPSRTVVRPGESLRLRYAVLCHSGALLDEEQLEAAYEDYVNDKRPSSEGSP